MPLEKSCDLDAFKANVAELIRSGRDRKQAVAIAHEALRDACDAEGKPVPRTDSDDAPVPRYDLSRLGKGKKTPQGFLRFDARLTRVGVLKYRKADGSIQRELRPPEEVFKEDSLATLAGAPMTDLHVAMVTPENVRNVRVGGISEQVRHDDQYVEAVATLEDHSIIRKVDSGERGELSAGYHCRLDFTPGVWNGEHYDAVQRDIVYNHVAIGPTGWGRAGSDVALRLDGNAAVLDSDVSDVIHQEVNRSAGGGGAQADEHPRAGDSTMKRTIRIDGIEYEVEANESAFQAYDKLVAKQDGEKADLQKRLDAAETKYADDMAFVSAWHEALQGRYDGQTRELDKARTDLAEANKPERIDSLVNERVELVSKARNVLGAEAKFDGQTPRQIKEAVLQKIDAEVKLDGKSDEYVDGLFDFSIKNHKRADGAAGSRQAGTPPPPNGNEGQGRQDGVRTPAQARAEMIKGSEEAWRPAANS